MTRSNHGFCVHFLVYSGETFYYSIEITLDFISDHAAIAGSPPLSIPFTVLYTIFLGGRHLGTVLVRDTRSLRHFFVFRNVLFMGG